MIREIDVSRILPHPENSNRMDRETLSKLRRHVESTGRYEPLVVRPHPAEEDKFQVLNGHHRLQVLKALGQTKAQCVVWQVDDDQARIYLATLNRLSGEDIPERRALLIGNLLGSFAVDDLAGLLPEKEEQLAELERLAKVHVDELAPQPPVEVTSAPQVVLEFFLDQNNAQQVNLALDLVAHKHPEMAGRSDALLHLAGCYLSSDASGTGISPVDAGGH